jgi:hypothetical protein
MAKQTFYAVAEPVFSKWARDKDGDPRLDSFRVTKVLQTRPVGTLKAGSLAVKLTMEIPDRAFAPLRPEVNIVIPEELVQYPVAVVAADEG